MIRIKIIGPLPKTPEGNKYILAVMDQSSKFTKLYTLKNQKLETVINALKTGYRIEKRIPCVIVTDDNGQFSTSRWRDFAAEMGSITRDKVPYSLRSKSREREMREAKRKIRAYVNEDKDRWDRRIDHAEKIINLKEETAIVSVINAAEKIQTIEKSEIVRFISEMHRDNRAKNNSDNETTLTESLRTTELERGEPTKSMPEKTSNLKKRRKSSIISEKGARYISRFITMISGEKKIPIVVGTVEGRRMNVRFDKRGEFNVISKAAVKEIESNGKTLEKIPESNTIPAYLKREKRIKFKATKVQIVVF